MALLAITIKLPTRDTVSWIIFYLAMTIYSIASRPSNERLGRSIFDKTSYVQIEWRIFRNKALHCLTITLTNKAGIVLVNRKDMPQSGRFRNGPERQTQHRSAPSKTTIWNDFKCPLKTIIMHYYMDGGEQWTKMGNGSYSDNRTLQRGISANANGVN